MGKGAQDSLGNMPKNSKSSRVHAAVPAASAAPDAATHAEAASSDVDIDMEVPAGVQPAPVIAEVTEDYCECCPRLIVPFLVLMSCLFVQFPCQTCFW